MTTRDPFEGDNEQPARPARLSDRKSGEWPALRSKHLTVLFAHDPGSSTCDALIERVGVAGQQLFVSSSLEELGSLEAAWVALDRARRSADTTLVLACLDLPPAPRAGATVAEWARSLKLPVVTVAHGRRWIPANRSGVALLPTLSPTADPEEIVRVLDATVAKGLAVAASGPPTVTALADAGFEPAPESFPGRPSWLG
ncbi:MAG: hypothetical protein HOW73_01370 [Polyangiaceae bacterium]|nr:hypothetical protein [Polyangiaceae bacterium]